MGWLRRAVEGSGARGRMRLCMLYDVRVRRCGPLGARVGKAHQQFLDLIDVLVRSEPLLTYIFHFLISAIHFRPRRVQERERKSPVGVLRSV